jgi:hypothetical protein
VKKHSRHVVEPNGPALAELIERLKARSEAAGRVIARVILTHEAGRDGSGWRDFRDGAAWRFM